MCLPRILVLMLTSMEDSTSSERSEQAPCAERGYKGLHAFPSHIPRDDPPITRDSPPLPSNSTRGGHSREVTSEQVGARGNSERFFGHGEYGAVLVVGLCDEARVAQLCWRARCPGFAKKPGGAASPESTH